VLAHASSGAQAASLLTSEVDVVLIDQCWFAEPEGWTLAPSLKQIRPRVPIVLLLHGTVPGEVQPPTAVDCMVSDTDMRGLLAVLKQLANRPVKH